MQIKEANQILPNGSKISIRSCRATDAWQFENFQERIAQETQNTYMSVASKNLTLIQEHWEKALESPNDLIVGAFVDDVLVGQVSVFLKNPNNPVIRHIANASIMIFEEFWGSGLAGLLMNSLVPNILQTSIRKIEATVRVSNTRAIYAYTKLGFRIEGIRKDSFFINDQFEDEYYLGLCFTNSAELAKILSYLQGKKNDSVLNQNTVSPQ